MERDASAGADTAQVCNLAKWPFLNRSTHFSTSLLFERWEFLTLKSQGKGDIFFMQYVKNWLVCHLKNV